MSQEFRAGRAINRIPPARRSPAPVDQDGALQFTDPPPRAEPTTTTDPAPNGKPPIVMRIRFQLNGFPIEIEAVGKIDQLPATVKKLRQLGAVPPGEAAPDWPDEPFDDKA